MRPCAKIKELAITVKCDRLPFGNVVNPFNLVLLPQLFVMRYGLFTRHFRALKHLVFLGHLFHLRLDAFKVIGRETMFEVKIIIKPLISGWADVQFCIRPNPQHRSRQHVRA